MTPDQAAQGRAIRAFASAMRGLVGATADFMTEEQKVTSLRQYLAHWRLPADLVWQAVKSPWATGSDGWADVPANREAFWNLAAQLESRETPGILVGNCGKL